MSFENRNEHLLETLIHETINVLWYTQRLASPPLVYIHIHLHGCDFKDGVTMTIMTMGRFFLRWDSEEYHCVYTLI